LLFTHTKEGSNNKWGISEQDIIKVKESTDLVALISEHVPLKRTGRRYSGCCPFHDEKNTIL
jgi:DNA primase